MVVPGGYCLQCDVCNQRSGMVRRRGQAKPMGGTHLVRVRKDHDVIQYRLRSVRHCARCPRPFSLASRARFKKVVQGKPRRWVSACTAARAPGAATRAAALAGEDGVAHSSGAQAVVAPTACMVGLRVAAGTSEQHGVGPPPSSDCASPHTLSRVSRMRVHPGHLPLLEKRQDGLALLQ